MGIHITAAAILMSEIQSVIRLQTWLSPAFPIGAFSYSSGLETAIVQGWIWDQKSLGGWLTGLVTQGPGWNDCVLLTESWRIAEQSEKLANLVDLAIAMNFSRERHLETTAQGNAFLTAVMAWGKIPNLPADCPLPIAVGVASRTHKIGLEPTLAAFVHAYVSNQVQAALRLMRLGQQGGVNLLADLEPVTVETSLRASKATLEDLGSSAVMADIALMQHESLQTRIFRS